MGLLGDRFDRLDFGGEQRPEDEPRPIADHCACGAGRAGCVPAGVARHQDQAVAAALEQGQLRRVEDGPTKFGIGARQRDEQGHFRRPRRIRGGRHGRGARRNRGWGTKAVTVIGRLRSGDRRRYHRRSAGGERGQGEGGKG